MKGVYVVGKERLGGCVSLAFVKIKGKINVVVGV